MNTSSIKKTVAVVMISVLTVLSGCSYDVPEGYKKELHSYEEAVEYAKEIDPDATVSAECEETELQTVKFRVWPAVIEGRECSVCSMGANVYNNGWAAGEFPIRYYRLDTDYDYYIISEILKSHPDLEQKDKAGMPYFGHIARVSNACKTGPAKVVALLHDIIEDTDVTSEQLEEAGMSEFVIKAVLCLTRKNGEPYEDFIRRAAKNPIAREVKIADLEDNMDVRRLENVTEDDFKRMDKYLNAWKYLKSYTK